MIKSSVSIFTGKVIAGTLNEKANTFTMLSIANKELPSPSTWSVEDLTLWLDQLLDKFELGRPVILYFNDKPLMKLKLDDFAALCVEIEKVCERLSENTA